jgi:DNA-binding MarR family transcriptional regulator
MKDEEIINTIKSLISSYDEYYKTEPSEPFDLQAFSVWLYDKEGRKKKTFTMKKHADEVNGTSNEVTMELPHGGVDDKISFIFLSMHKLVKFYVKKVLEGTQLVSQDDIHYLMFLSQTDSLTKSEIINNNMTEMSSGIEVLKRLQKKELIEDFEDPDDKRSRRVKITQKGLEEIKRVTAKFMNVHKLMGYSIPEEEKFDLLALLNKIYEYHIKIYNTEKNTPIAELFEKYL